MVPVVERRKVKRTALISMAFIPKRRKRSAVGFLIFSGNAGRAVAEATHCEGPFPKKSGPESPVLASGPVKHLILCEYFALVPNPGTFFLLPRWEQCRVMQVLSRKALRDFWQRHPRARGPLQAWYKIVVAAEWNAVADVKSAFRTADFIGDKRVIFDIGGNKYRIVARIVYGPYYRVMIKFVGTHDEYERINPETV
jgi:mRNA interferase HigB